MTKKYEIWTDGASARNGKPDCAGGWAFIVLCDGKEVHRGSGYEKPSSNQRMELTAAIEGVKSVFASVGPFDAVTIYSDSAYLINCKNQNWWRNWMMNGWKNAKQQPVANQDLWELLVPYFQMSNVEWVKVKGHNGVALNEEVDKMAVAAKIKGDKEIVL